MRCHNPGSHSETQAALKLNDRDWREVEWRASDDKPSIRFRAGDDADTCEEVRTWLHRLAPTRLAMCKYVLAHCAGLTHLSCDAATVLPKLPAGLTHLSCDAATVLPKLPAGLTTLSCDAATVLPKLPAGLTHLYCNSATAMPQTPPAGCQVVR